ncbi:methyltransferase domain-containing protein [Lichenihabitans sp. PAMC28606]|uniref:methyltransferase domain-containing protein n=1 Tax=Lichenihabitans sp. PAMC28606 TaxID=2880932 RepID=UPI001D0AFFEC|nr:methyltransferase domain-containing protein [Lichenihabitans sp. PAMC28606]UDL95904.1 methyltransferase domain-containing protein [Lichenihabitans sp. PAMC28606]
MAQTPFSAPTIFDRTLLRHRLARSRSGGGDFLLDRAAEDAVDRLAPVQRQFRDILDLGTGSPALADRLAGALPEARLVRSARIAEAADPRWLTVVSDEELLPFGPERFDLIMSVLALHVVNDLPGALVQIRRALKPDGLVIACLMGGQSLTELRAALTQAEIELTGGASPRVAPFSDLRDLGSLMQRAALALPVTDSEPLTVRYSSMFGLLDDLRAMGATNAMVERSRKPMSRSLLLRAAAIYAERFSDPDGRVRATFELVWLSGWAPHESQQKPLKPGSAKMRLADALNAKPME